VPAQPADVPITIAILPEAQRMVDEADERWVAEHGFLADNPLLNEILRASDLLRINPQIGVVVRRGRSEIRRLLLHSGWHLYYRFHGDRQLVEILAVWFASRGSTPLL
jgi:plasmid stabilization system protein ParE